MDVNLEFANIPLPTLPTIRSDSIRNQVFTHRSLHARSTLLFEDLESTDTDNERLEFLGDSILHFCATLLLHQTFPLLKCGPASTIRGIILSNRTFAAISKRYRLIEQILSDPNNSTEILSSSKIQGTIFIPLYVIGEYSVLLVHLADLFEAYIAGVYMDRGLEATQEFLFKLLEPHALAAYRVVRYQHGIDDESVSDKPKDPHAAAALGNLPSTHSTGDEPGDNSVSHPATLHQYAEKLGKSVLYTFSPLPPVNDTPWWESTVLVDGDALATARGTTKKAAKNHSAALAIKEIIKVS
jgi:ribonuclease-3